MTREEAISLKAGDMIRVRYDRYGDHLAIVTKVEIGENGCWAWFNWIGSPGGWCTGMQSDLVEKVNTLLD